MAQKYPMIKPWLEYHRVSDDEYEIENEIAPGEIDEDPLRLPGHFVDFMQKLNGKTNPYIIDPSINKRTVRTYIRFLSKRGIYETRNATVMSDDWPIPLLNLMASLSIQKQLYY